MKRMIGHNKDIYLYIFNMTIAIILIQNTGFQIDIVAILLALVPQNS